MAFLSNLFSQKKKKSIKASCPITKEPIESGDGYMLSTRDVVRSKKYWDMVMTEPETLSYTRSHFMQESSGTQMRSLIFEKYSSINKPWIVSDSCISLFEVDKENSRQLARKWWDSEGQFTPEQSGAAAEVLDPKEFESVKRYAILEAGKARVAAA
jgi:hypothetical protein